MKLTQDEHIRLLLSAGVTKDTAAAQVDLVRRARVDLAESLTATIRNLRLLDMLTSTTSEDKMKASLIKLIGDHV